VKRQLSKCVGQGNTCNPKGNHLHDRGNGMSAYPSLSAHTPTACSLLDSSMFMWYVSRCTYRFGGFPASSINSIAWQQCHSIDLGLARNVCTHAGVRAAVACASNR